MREKISRPGQYYGYSDKLYAESVQVSRYLYIRGNNLAIDIYRPAKDGLAIEEPYPAILQNKRYQRRGDWTDFSLINSWVEHGYVVAVLDPRGAGASFGSRIGDWSIEEALDGREVIEWLASQPYCNGKVGMWGFSYMGGIQYMIASTRPPHLVAIVPNVTTIDQYFRCPNGVVWTPTRSPKSITYPLDTAGKSACPPQNVDEDPEGVMLAQAVEEHKKNVYSDQAWIACETYRNQYNLDIKNMNFIAQSAITYKDDIKASKVAIYSQGGWFDAAPAQALGAWKIWGAKVIIGPWGHALSTKSDVTRAEHLRWFDYHLKGIQNGIMEEAPICYYTFNAPPGREWRFTSRWPLPAQKLTKFYFDVGHTGTSASVNDGSLAESPPMVSEAWDKYTVDYSIKAFEEEGVDRFKENERTWNGEMEKSTDSKGLTFTSRALASDIEVTGFPVLHLWVSSTSRDCYVFAFLEEVDGEIGVSHFVTHGMIRASCRALSTKFPWTDLGMQYHRCYDVDYQPLTPGKPASLDFDLYPISYIFRKGARIRMTITCSLQSTYGGMKEDPPPQINVYRDLERVSYLELPIIVQDPSESGVQIG